jgi:hypothetical protein
MSVAAALFATLTLQQPDPLAPARTGQVLCYEPDVARQTCYGIASYRWLGDGTIVSDIVVAASEVPAIFVHSSAPVFVRGDAECTRLVPSADQITAIYEDGRRLGGSEFESFRRILGSSIDQANGRGRELCFTYEPLANGDIKSTARIDGVARPDLGGTARWVRPADGWRVGF